MSVPDATGRGENLETLLSGLRGHGPGALPLAERVKLVEAIRRRSADWGVQLDEHFLRETDRLWGTVQEVRERQSELERLHDRLTAPPWHPAVFLGVTDTARGLDAVVAFAGSVRVVSLLDGVDPLHLRPGEEVLLGADLNVVVGRLAQRYLSTGETAQFDRALDDGRLVVRSRDEDIVVRAAADLDQGALSPGDQVRWSRGVGVAFERLDRTRGDQLFMEGTPADTFADIGGLDAEIGQLQRLVRLHVEAPDTVRRYRVRPKTSVLLAGPPGTGKTLLARALANWIARLIPSGRSRFMNVKPAGLHSMWYAQSEANYREAFRVAREAGAREPGVPVVMFFDEVDAVGGHRGLSLQGVDDRVLTAFMSELDGLEARGNILVVAATNRRDALDPALLRPGRLGDLVLEIRRPGRDAARQVFARHLPADVPCAEGDRREALMEAAVSRIYAPNGLGDLATVTLRDGKRRAISGRDLVSGAVIAKICQTALEQACLRDRESGEVGIRRADLLGAIDAELETAARALTARNCHWHIDDLPHDVDVVKVEPVVRQVRAEHRFLRLA